MTVVSGQTYADLLARCETAEYHLSIAQTLAKQAEMTLRDQFAMAMQVDDRLVKCVRAMDDRSLEMFARYADVEREECIAEVEFTDWLSLTTETQKVARRLELEARAIARVRYMQADAMLRARTAQESAK